MTWTEFFQMLGIAGVILVGISFLVVLYMLSVAALLDWADRKKREQTDAKFFKMIERFRDDFEQSPQDD